VLDDLSRGSHRSAIGNELIKAETLEEVIFSARAEISAGFGSYRQRCSYVDTVDAREIHAAQLKLHSRKWCFGHCADGCATCRVRHGRRCGPSGQ
jgi:hypothetical protein